MPCQTWQANATTGSVSERVVSLIILLRNTSGDEAYFELSYFPARRRGDILLYDGLAPTSSNDPTEFND